MVSDAGGSLQVTFSSLRMYFSPLIPLVIDQVDTFYDPSCLIHRLRIAHTQRDVAELLFLFSFISVYFFICSQTEFMMGQGGIFCVCHFVQPN